MPMLPEVLPGESQVVSLRPCRSAGWLSRSPPPTSFAYPIRPAQDADRGGKFWLEIWLEIHKGQVLQAGSKPFKAESHSKPGGVYMAPAHQISSITPWCGNVPERPPGEGALGHGQSWQLTMIIMDLRTKNMSLSLTQHGVISGNHPKLPMDYHDFPRKKKKNTTTSGQPWTRKKAESRQQSGRASRCPR